MRRFRAASAAKVVFTLCPWWGENRHAPVGGFDEVVPAVRCEQRVEALACLEIVEIQHQASRSQLRPDGGDNLRFARDGEEPVGLVRLSHEADHAHTKAAHLVERTESDQLAPFVHGD